MKKKLFSLAVTLVMALSLAVPAMAADITVTNSVKGETYNVYKIFDVTEAEGATEQSGYAYTITDTDAADDWYETVKAYADVADNGLTLTPTTTEDVYNVSVSDAFDPADFAATLSGAMAGKTVTASGTGNGEALTITVEQTGYYFVDTSLGSLCSLLTSDQSVELVEKNDVPDIEKTAQVTSASVGDTIPFQITVTNGVGLDNTITVTDTMNDALDFNNDIKVYLGSVADGNIVAMGADTYSVSYPTEEDEFTFKVVFAADYVKSLESNSILYITYSAVVNENGIVDTPMNAAYMEYSNQTIVPETPEIKVENYSFDLVKTTDDGTVLSGATFELYKGEEKLVLTYDETNHVYRIATAEEQEAEGFEAAVITAGQATVAGLANGTYYLQEVGAPEGYNLLTNRVKVVIDSQDIDAVDTNVDSKYVAADGDTGIIVINESGAILPGTGGMGTTIFYVVGGTLVVAAAVLLITKKRMHNVED